MTLQFFLVFSYQQTVLLQFVAFFWNTLLRSTWSKHRLLAIPEVTTFEHTFLVKCRCFQLPHINLKFHEKKKLNQILSPHVGSFQCKLALHQTLALPIQVPAAAPEWTDGFLDSPNLSKWCNQGSLIASASVCRMEFNSLLHSVGLVKTKINYGIHKDWVDGWYV